MRPIDADAMIERYNVKNTDIAECLTNPETARKFEKFSIIADALEKEPTLNLVRVVRCKDCRFCEKVDDYEYWCKGFCSPSRLVNPNDYCSRGRRKRCSVESCGYCEDHQCWRGENSPRSRNCPFDKEGEKDNVEK